MGGPPREATDFRLASEMEIQNRKTTVIDDNTNVFSRVSKGGLE